MEVTGGFFLLLAWINYCDSQSLLPAVLCAAAAHELGHLLCVWAVGGRVSLLRLTAAGAELRLEGALSYVRELLCVLSGPAVNVLLAVWAARTGGLVFSGLNLALGLFNLLPLSALDGGRALFCAGALLFGTEWAGRLGRWADRALCGLLLACAIEVFRSGGSVTLLVVACWFACLLLGSEWEDWRKKGLSRTV